MPQFLWFAFKTSRQAQRSPGFLDGAVINDKQRVFWTLTVWESEAAMKQYRGADWHQQAMTKLAHWCDEASVVHWTGPQTRVPTAAEAHAHMTSEGRPSRVNHPSPSHASMHIAAPTRPALPLKAAQQSQRPAA